MATRKNQPETNAVFFCTVTCFQWLSLFEKTNLYDHIYNWFSYLNTKGVKVCGYVIMPNHLHILLYLPQKSPSINKIIANAKRFMAYEIIKRLGMSNQTELLADLQSHVQKADLLKGKLHEVFQPSFDAKICETEKFLKQKLDYIHLNPVKGKWNLVEDYVHFPHSSAAFYELGLKSGFVEITHYSDVFY